MAAEASLRRFVETLTETFAHLPIGLAVFDKNRRLGLFNPALTELVKIDAVWLAGRPSLRDFLERLRETRQMPEQKDFASWRRKLSELEEGAREGTYEESWQLPSGKIFRVTGRPHPQGALAFLFEDISDGDHARAQVPLRARAEPGDARPDDRGGRGVRRLGDAGLRQFGLRAALGARPDGAAGRAGRRGDDRALGRALRAESGLGAAGRVRHRRRGAHQLDRDGRDPRRVGRSQVLVAPLPDASALVVFRAGAAEHGDAAARPRDGLLDEIAFEQALQPAEAAVQKLMAAIPAAPSPEAFQALGGVVQALKDGVARARELRALAAGAATAAEGPLPELTRALAARGLTLDAPPDAATWAPELRRAALALGLAAAEVGEAGSAVALGLDAGDGRMTARVPARGGRAEGAGLALARRVIEAAGGSLERGLADGVATLAASLPASRGEVDPPDLARRA